MPRRGRSAKFDTSSATPKTFFGEESDVSSGTFETPSRTDDDLNETRTIDQNRHYASGSLQMQRTLQKPTSTQKSADQTKSIPASVVEQRPKPSRAEITPKAGPSSRNRKKTATPKRRDDNTRLNFTSVPKRKRKDHALREIRHLRQTVDTLIPRLPFSRVIREVMLQFNQDLRITPQALIAIQESSEIYLTYLFEDAYKCTLHRKAVTLQVKDMALVRFLRGPIDPGNRVD